jgi:hypothetical protein
MMEWERVAYRFAERAVKGMSLEVRGSGRQTIDSPYHGWRPSRLLSVAGFGSRMESYLQHRKR